MFLLRIRITAAIFFAAFFLANISAKAADFTENDLSAPISDTNDYNNVTVNNNSTLSSGTVTGGYVYFGGTVDGNVNFTNSGSITSSHSNYGVLYMPSVGNTSSTKTVSIENTGSLISSGSSAVTLYVIGKNDGSFPDFTRRSFDFSLDNSNEITTANNGLYVINGASGTHSITNSGTMSSSSTSDSSFVINLSGGSSATITNTGSIEASAAGKTAISVDVGSGSITNSGTGSITGIIKANGGVATNLTVTNNSSGGITGNITTSNADLDVINTSGTITGNVTLGDNASSSIAINGGSISGNVTMNNSAQNLTFGGGTLSGTINGAGGISVNSNTVLNGNIGASTSLTSINIAASRTLNAATNNNSIRATNITLNSGSILSMGNGALTGSVDGSGSGRGTLNLTFDSNSTIGASIGSSNSLAAVNFTADSSASLTLSNSLSASEVTVTGIDGALTLGSSVGINGNVTIGDRSNLLLGNSSFVNGTISADTDSSGALQIQSNTTVNFSSDIGSSLKKLGSVSVMDDTTVTTSAAIRSNTISIGSDATLASSSTLIGTFDLNTNATLNLQNGASVTGDINPGGIVEEGVVNSSGTVSITGQIGSGGAIKSINVNSGSQLSIAASSIEAVNTNITGQLNLSNATTINSNVTLLGSSSKINLNGNSQTINGAFTSASGSTIASTIHSATSIDKLTVSGAASMNSNTKLSLSISGITPGSSYTIIDGGSGSSISAITNSNIDVNGSGTNRFGKYIFRTSVSGNDLLLNSSLASITSSNGNRGAIYDNITNANAGTSGGLYTMQEYLYGDTSDDTKNAALDSAMPQVDNASNRSIFNSANTTFDLSSNRMQSLYSGLASGEEVIEKNRTFWVQAFGSNVNQGNTSISEGYKSNIRGLAFGADKEISENSLIGISGSYSDSSVKSRSALKQTNINSYQINGYGGYHRDNYFINALAGFVWSEYDSNRFIPVAVSSAAAKYHGQTYIARAEIGMMQKLQKGFFLTPTAMLTAAHNRVEDYSEEGAGTLNLSVRNKSTDFFEGRAGIALKKNFYVSNYAVIPEIFASYGYDFAGSKQRTNSNFVGQTSSFDSSASNIARGSFKSGVTTKIFGNETLSFNLDYVFEMRQNYHANSAALKSSYKF